MYSQREDDGTIAILLNPKEAWMLMSVATVGLTLTTDKDEIAFLLACQDAGFLLDTDEIVDLAMEEEAEHGHTDEELIQLREKYRKSVEIARTEGLVDR